MAKKNFEVDETDITGQLFGGKKKPAPEQIMADEEKVVVQRKAKTPAAPQEDESYKMFTTKMRTTLHKTLKKAAVEEDRSILQVLDNALTEYFEKNGYM